MTTRSIIVRIGANIDDLRRGLNEGTDLARRQGDAMDNVGKKSMIMGAAMAAGLLISAKAAIDWESQWAGVTKTVGGSAEQMATLEKQLRGMALTLPASQKEIAGVAEAAGQLGIKREDIAGFTKTMIDLGVSTNLSSDEAATGIAQIGNVMGLAGDDIQRFGATLVQLGNNGASTEADILHMAQRIAGAGKLVGASSSDVLALANALSSMGINAELGSGVMTRTMTKIYSAVTDGGGQLDRFAKIAGVSSAEFAESFRSKPVEAIDSFVQGLGRIKSEGGNVVQALGDVGLKGTLNMQVLLQMAGAGDLLSDSLKMGNEAWASNTALVNEANKRYDTTASKIQLAKNSVTDLAINLGDVMLPAISAAADGLANLAQFFSNLPEPVRAALVVLSTLGAVVALAGGAALIVVPKFLALEGTLTGLGVSATRAAATVSLLNKALLFAGVAGAVLAVAGALAFVTRSKTDVDKLNLSLTDFSLSAKNGGKAGKDVQEQFKAMAQAFKEGGTQGKAAAGSLAEIDKALAGMVAGGKADQAQTVANGLRKAFTDQGVSVDDVNSHLTKYGDALHAAGQQQDESKDKAYQLADSVGAVTTKLGTAYDSLGAFAKAQGMSEEQTKDLTKQVEDWGAALAGFIQPLDAYTGLLKRKEDAEQATAEKTAEATKKTTDSWKDYVHNVDVSVAEYLTELDKQVAAQTNWATNMTILSGRVSQGTLDELARMGPEGAPLVAKLTTATNAQLAQLDLDVAAKSKETVDGMAEQWRLGGPLLQTIAAKVGQDTATSLATQLAAGTTTVALIAQQYANVLGQGINPILTSLGKAPFVSKMGGHPLDFADGGYLPAIGDQQPQIQPNHGPGGIRWAETGAGPWEAFVSGHPAKRERSRAIVSETAQRLGGEAVFATGGFYSPDQVPKPYSTAPFRNPLSTAADAVMGAEYDALLGFLRDHPAGAGGGTQGGLDDVRAFIRGTDPLPYIWGGVGPRGYDCSGLVGEVYARATGRPSYRRYFTTASIGTAQGWLPGPGGVLAVGVNDHHMVGEYGGLPFEAESTATGIKIGNAASRVGSFPRQFHINSAQAAAGAFGPGPSKLGGHALTFADGGIVEVVQRLGRLADVAGDPSRLVINDKVIDDLTRPGALLNPHVRDSGGPLLPGLTYNGTGGNERTEWVHAAYGPGGFGGPGGGGPIQMRGTLTMDSGEVLGVFQGVAEQVVAANEADTARRVRAGRR